ncbi:MAG: hypothetical protein H6851_15295 [Geminicoccaceae bacterium]|nr:hypothetical protein [Geminicoccaceae bacterium]
MMRHPNLPSGFELVILPGSENPKTIVATQIMGHGEMADGLVVWRESALRLDCVFMVHLQPGEDVRAATDLMLAALGDTVAAILPDDVELTVTQPPAAVRVNGRELCRIGVLTDTDGLSGSIGLAIDIPVASQSFGTSLAAMGVDDVETAGLIEALATHLVTWAVRVERDGADVLWAHLDARGCRKLH